MTAYCNGLETGISMISSEIKHEKATNTTLSAQFQNQS